MAVFYLFITPNTSAQGEADNWYFGSFAGLNFSTNPPTTLTNGALSTSEGCATISDPAGNLMFYSDGIRVWDRNHNVMPNGTGLGGDPSSAQSGIIVPKPGANGRYYIFTTNAVSPIAFRYSEVDMSLNGGFGDVIAATKNTLLYSGSAEKITAVKHGNGLYYWVVGRDWTTPNYRAFLVDCNGVNPVPVVSAGLVNGESWGYLVASPDGSRLASASVSSGFEVSNFNNLTGVVSNTVNLGFLNYAGYAAGSYGVAFSPNGNVLYGTNIQNWALGQWDLTAANIPASLTFISYTAGASATRPGYHGGGMQLARDGRIYMTDCSLPSLSVINNPNVLGVGCNYQASVINLQGRNSILGLPPFVQTFFDTASYGINHAQICFGNTTSFNVTGAPNLDSLRWDFGDPASGTANTSNVPSPGHVFSAPGNYGVRLIRYLGCIKDTTDKLVTIHPIPTAGFGAGNVCMGNAMVFADSSLNAPATWHWNFDDGSVDSVQNPTHTYADTGTYSVTLITQALGCRDTLVKQMTVHPLPTDTAAVVQHVGCFGGHDASAIVNVADTTGYTYSWTTAPVQTGQTADSLTAGNYTVTITDGNGCQTVSSVTITEPAALQDSAAVVQHVTCFGGNDGSAVTTPNGGMGAYAYAWNSTPPQTTQTAVNLTAGNYTVTVTDSNGCITTSSVTVSEPAQLAITQSNIQHVTCFGGNNGSVSVNVTGGVGTYGYSWNSTPAQTTQMADSLVAGTYTVTVTDTNGCSMDSAFTVIQPPQLNMQLAVDDSTVCLGMSATMLATATGGTGNYVFTWNNGLPAGASQTVSPAANTLYTATVTDSSGCTDQQAMTITIFPLPQALFTANGTEGCVPFCVNFTNQSSISVGTITQYTWYKDGNYMGNAANPNHCFQEAGVYGMALVARSNEGCTDSLAIPQMITVHDNPVADFTYSPDIISISEPVVQFIDQSTGGGAGWIWNFGDQGSSTSANPNHTYGLIGTYTVYLQVTSPNDCKDTVSKVIEIHPQSEVFVPNTFTPNGDNFNAVWMPSISYMASYELQIFNRWGELLFYSDDIFYGWDGTYLNRGEKQLPMGVYVYRINYKEFTGRRKVLIGNVNLIR